MLFGSAIAASSGLNFIASAAGMQSVYVFDCSSIIQCWQASFKPSTAVSSSAVSLSFSNYGQSGSLAINTAATMISVGDAFANVGGTNNEGIDLVFACSDVGGTYPKCMFPSRQPYQEVPYSYATSLLPYASGTTNDFYGYSVGVSALGSTNLVVVGAPQYDWLSTTPALSTQPGYALVYSCTSATSCNQINYLSQPLPAQSSFGGAVAVSNGFIAIGAPLYNPSSTNDGAVFHYFCNGTCSLVSSTTAVSGSAGNFGASVAVSYISIVNQWNVAVGLPGSSSSAGSFVSYTCTTQSCTTGVSGSGFTAVSSDLVQLKSIENDK